jgi:tetratricopeptide (TPR) repeat protein
MSKSKNPKDFPQSTDTWYFAIRRLDRWLNNADGEIIRPYLYIVYNMDLDIIHNMSIEEQSNETEARRILFKAMTEPIPKMDIPVHRPDRIFFEDLALSKALCTQIKEWDIICKYRSQKDIIDEILKEMESKDENFPPKIPGLLSGEKVSVKILLPFFNAAAEFYRAAPWIQLSNHDILAVKIKPQKEPYYLIIMGQAGIQYGFTFYLTWEDVKQLFSEKDHLHEAVPSGGYHYLSFENKTRIPIEDIDAIEDYHLEIAGEEAFPAPFIIYLAGEIKRPNLELIQWYEAAMRAVPILVKEYISRNSLGEIEEVEASIPVTTSAGKVTVEIKIPAGTIERPLQGTFTDQDEEEEIPFDRRLLEADMNQMFPSFINIDKKLAKAQKMLYQALEETNPAIRIIKAHQALRVSPDCSDAYVLLAEEEASSLKEAMDLYREGIEAGKRALGEDYFKENVGDFWGLIETRPFMRSMEGYANCLWRSGQRKESLEIYEEMLRLNPEDNQGIRYILLDLYLTMNNTTALNRLLKDYEDEYSAEWFYTYTLVKFRKLGDRPTAQRLLKRALRFNPYVADYLTGKKRIPHKLPAYIGFGDENEAITYVSNHLNYWRQTEGAVDWLKKYL